MAQNDFALDSPEVKFAVEVVEAGCRLARRIQDELATASIEKDDRSPVTVADFAVQAWIGRCLGQSFPGEMLVGEESAELLRRTGQGQLIEHITGLLADMDPEAQADDVLRWIDRGQGKPAQRFWVVDPIDGTKGFLRDGQYAVARALVEGGGVQLGVLGCPRLELSLKRGEVKTRPSGQGCLLVAARGRGSWMKTLGGKSFQRLAVSSVSQPGPAVVVRSVEAGHTNVARFETLLNFMGTRQQPLLMDSQAKYGLLAAGQADLLLRLLSAGRPDYREKIWDQAAAAIILEEAGGTITDLDGKPLDFSVGRKLVRNRGILASNGHLHSAVLEALRQVERDE
jgi:3'(2'), 5'-bisphosphate nucleotidase